MANLLASAARSSELPLNFWVGAITLIVSDLATIVALAGVASSSKSSLLLVAVTSKMGIITAARALSAKLLALKVKER
jgi:hypothetical protein